MTPAVLTAPPPTQNTAPPPAELNPTKIKVRFKPGEGFQKELKRRVDEYFEKNNLSQRDAPAMYRKTAVILTWFLASYLPLILVPTLSLPVAILLIISTGLAAAGIGFSIQHDGGHKAYSDNQTINKIMAFTLDMIGASSFFWNFKHNSFHHTYTNITGLDEDIELGPFGRLSPHKKWYPHHRIQHLYLWFLYGFITLKWNLMDDFETLIRRRIADHTITRPRGWDLVLFFFGKAFFFGWTMALPIALGFTWWKVVLAYCLGSYVLGFTIAVVFQLAHTLEEATFPMPAEGTNRMENDWAVHQIETTVDFARDSKFLCWYLGGLNFQVEHHLFPRICHIHYPELAKIVEETSREFGVNYQANATFFAGVRSHYRWLRQLSVPNPVPA